MYRAEHNEVLISAGAPSATAEINDLFSTGCFLISLNYHKYIFKAICFHSISHTSEEISGFCGNVIM